jgi:hypothetical protein
MSPHDIRVIALIAVAVLNAIVSAAVALSTYYSPRQKLLQIIFVWLLPVLGATLFGLFLWSQRGNAPRTGYRSTTQTPMDDVTAVWSGLNSSDKLP